MTRELMEKISEVCGIAASVRLSADGGIAFYPVEDSLKATFLDEGELRLKTIKVKLKGENPASLFLLAEEICEKLDKDRQELLGEDFRVLFIRPYERPVMESCSENGMNIVSFALAAEYILEKEGKA